MKLPNIAEVIGKKEEKEGIFASFVVGKNWIQAGLWQIIGGRGELVASGTTDSWQDTESFVQAADDSLSSAMGSMESPPEETRLVVFGLPTSWIENGQIAQAKLEYLKVLCERLELQPAGFVVLPEAIIHFLKNKEGEGVSFILVGMEEEELEVILVRGGKIVDSQNVSRSISMADDITEGLSRFGTALPLPGRIILFNRHKNILEEAVQSLLGWEWPVSFFLHAPRVEFLSAEELLSAVSFAAAGELAQVESFGAIGKISQAEDEQEKIPSETIPEKPPFNLFELFTSLGRGFIGVFSFFARLRGSGRPLIALSILFILVLGLLWWFLPKATVTIYVAPRKIEGKVTLSVDPTGKEAADVVPGRIVSLDVSGEKTSNTTGSKTVGERARGEVTIFNNTVGPKTFTAGTLITGPNGLKFTLDGPLTVASASGIPPVLGQAKANVTGVDIGAEYNLASGSPFSVANFATISFSAKNDNPFVGGSSREVSAVSREDMRSLEEELSSELLNKFKSQIGANIRPDETTIGEAAKLNTIQRTFSANVGDEAQTLRLNLTAQGQTVVAPRDKLNQVLMKAISSKVPQEFSLSQEQIKASFVTLGEQKGVNILRFEANVTGDVLPNIDPKRLAREIAGKNPGSVKNKLSSLPGFTRVSIKISPALPLFSNLPQRGDNIKILLSVEQ